MCGWREPGEDGAFAPEPLFAAAADQRDVQQLDRGAALEAAVAAFGEPDAAHPALADGREQPVGAEDLARQRRHRASAADRATTPLEEARVVHRLVAGEHAIGDRRRAPGRAPRSTPATRSCSAASISSASSRYGLSARHRSGLMGGIGGHAVPDCRCRSRDADRGGPSPSCAGWSVPRRRASRRSRRRRSRRRTSGRRSRRGPARPRRARRARR